MWAPQSQQMYAHQQIQKRSAERGCLYGCLFACCCCFICAETCECCLEIVCCLCIAAVDG